MQHVVCLHMQHLQGVIVVLSSVLSSSRISTASSTPISSEPAHYFFCAKTWCTWCLLVQWIFRNKFRSCVWRLFSKSKLSSSGFRSWLMWTSLLPSFWFSTSSVCDSHNFIRGLMIAMRDTFLQVYACVKNSTFYCVIFLRVV